MKTNKEKDTNKLSNKAALLVGLITFILIITLIKLDSAEQNQDISLNGKIKESYSFSYSNKLIGNKNIDGQVIGLSIGNKKQMKKRSFAKLLSSSILILPTINNVRSSGGDLIHGKSHLVKSAMAIGKIEDKVKKSPELRLMAIKFYQKCTHSKVIYKPIRALCLDYVLTHQKVLGQHLETANVSNTIKRIQVFSRL